MQQNADTGATAPTPNTSRNRILHLMAQIQAASEQLTRELHDSGAVGIWQIVRQCAEKGAMVEMFKLAHGNNSAAAARLDVNRNTLYKRAHEYGIDPSAPQYSHQHLWADTHSDLVIHVKRNGEQRGETTTGYLIAQALENVGFKVLVSEIASDREPPAATLDRPDSHGIPEHLAMRTVHVRIGGVA